MCNECQFALDIIVKDVNKLSVAFLVEKNHTVQNIKCFIKNDSSSNASVSIQKMLLFRRDKGDLNVSLDVLYEYTQTKFDKKYSPLYLLASDYIVQIQQLLSNKEGNFKNATHPYISSIKTYTLLTNLSISFLPGRRGRVRRHRHRVQHQLYAHLRLREEQQEDRRILWRKRGQTEKHHLEAQVDYSPSHRAAPKLEYIAYSTRILHTARVYCILYAYITYWTRILHTLRVYCILYA